MWIYNLGTFTKCKVIVVSDHTMVLWQIQRYWKVIYVVLQRICSKNTILHWSMSFSQHLFSKFSPEEICQITGALEKCCINTVSTPASFAKLQKISHQIHPKPHDLILLITYILPLDTLTRLLLFLFYLRNFRRNIWDKVDTYLRT